MARQTLTRLTVDPGLDQLPVWTPDGRRILFSSTRTGAPNLFWHAADGTGADQRLTTSVNPQYPNSVTPDGTRVLGYEIFPKTSYDVVRFALDGALSTRTAGAPADSVQRPSEPLVQTTFVEYHLEISPDGRYVAYQSNESGKDEVYVRPYPKVNDGRWQVSIGGRLQAGVGAQRTRIVLPGRRGHAGSGARADGWRDVQRRPPGHRV